MALTLSARSLEKSYGSYLALKGVSFELGRGEVVALLGPNGAGKTTAFSVVAGSLAPDRGTIEIEGRDITDLAYHSRAREGIFYLPQESSVFRKASVWQNLVMTALARGDSRSAVEARAEHWMAEFGLGPLRHRAADRLSGGETRRLEVARALVNEPSFLLLDEPFAGLDPVTVEQLHGLISKLREEGLGVLLTDHNAEASLRLCDRAYVLLDGAIARQGCSEEIRQDPTVRREYLGSDS